MTVALGSTSVPSISMTSLINGACRNHLNAAQTRHHFNPQQCRKNATLYLRLMEAASETVALPAGIPVVL